MLTRQPSKFLDLKWFLVMLAVGHTSFTLAQSESTASPANSTAPADSTVHDLVIYGGTSAAVVAGVQAKRMGKSVVIVCPDIHLGGLTSGGLGWTDTGNKTVIGGLAKEFYHRVYKHYRSDDAWQFQTREKYGNRAQGQRASDDDLATMWVFEPHVAENIFEGMIAEHSIPVFRDAWLDRKGGVKIKDGRIVSIRTLDGKTFRGRMFMDATYEGDLIATSGVTTTFGREGIQDFNEPHAGVQTGVLHHSHHFDVLAKPVDPYVVPGDPSSGVIPLVSPDPPGEFGSADKRIQAYCFRTCMTNHAPNRVDWPKPEGYDPGQYEVLVRCFEAGWENVFNKFDPLPNHKTDTNNHGPVSFDNIGFNYDYPEASYERRREIIRQHETYQKGLLYFIAHDPRVPKKIQSEMQQWGLAKDEFKDNGNWPHQIYVREARRMVGQFIMTENHLRKAIETPNSVGMGSYSIDSHNTQRYITPEGRVQNEGDIGISTHGPYKIAMGALLPKREQCQNLVVPVCVSSTHMAFGSIRMEPVFMILGQSAATVASLALDANSAVQDVPYETVQQRLIADGQILDTPPGVKASTKHHASLSTLKVPGITIDDDRSHRTGRWITSRSSSTFFNDGYRHDGNDSKNPSTAEFATKIPAEGDYEVRFAYPPHSNRSRRTAVTIHSTDAIKEILVDQTKPPVPFNKSDASDKPFHALGTFHFKQGEQAKVVISNRAANGYVVVDAVNWRLAK